MLAQVVYAQEEVTIQGILRPSERQERPVQPGDIQAWELPLETGQFVEIVFETSDLQSLVYVFAPSGNVPFSLSIFPTPWEDQRLRWIANEKGTWYVEIVPYDVEATGIYTVLLESQQPPTTRDQNILEADSLLLVAESAYYDGDYDTAQKGWELAFTLRDESGEKDTPTLAYHFALLAEMYFYGMNHAEVERWTKRALVVWNQTVQPDAYTYASSLERLGDAISEQGRHKEAASYMVEALAVREDAFGEVSAEVAWTVESLAHLSRKQNDVTEAERLFKRALEIWSTILPPADPGIAQALENLAQLYLLQGRTEEADPLLDRALSIRRQSLSEDDLARSSTHTNLSFLRFAQGRFAEGEREIRRSLDLEDLGLDLLAPTPLDSTTIGALIASGQYVEAERQLKLDLDSLAQESPPNLAIVAYTRNLLAGLYSEQGRVEEADSIYSLVLQETEQHPGTMPPLLAITFIASVRNLLSGVEIDLDRSLEQIDTAIEILDNMAGFAALRIDALALRAQIYRFQNRQTAAFADLEEALQLAEALRPQLGGGAQTRATLFEHFKDEFDRMVSWQVEVGNIERAFEFVERGRARAMLDQLAAGQVDIRAGIPADERELLEQRESTALSRITTLQQRLDRAHSQREMTEDEHHSHIQAFEDSLRNADRSYQQIYRDIMNASPLWHDQITSDGHPISLSEAQRELVPPSGFLVIYHIGSVESHAFVIPPEGQQPAVIPLVVPDSIAGLWDRSAGALTSTWLANMLSSSENEGDGGLIPQLSRSARGTKVVRAAGYLSTEEHLHALWQVLFPAPLWTRLKLAAEVVVVPDGALHHVPFEALVTVPATDSTDTRYWLDEGPPLRYAPSATSLYTITQQPDSITFDSYPWVLSLSDPIYDLDEATLALTEEREERNVTTEPGEGSPVRLGGGLARLPGTARETEAILKAFGDDASRNVTVLQGVSANEPNLREALASKRFLHLATHGLVDTQRGSLFASFALAPPAGDVATPQDDGLLQLHEIYGLDLQAVDLAVLSACQSNVGEQVEGEGVFALSRGFLAAGARRVIASQWAVDDASTAAIMQAFFERIVSMERAGQAIDYGQALRDAKRMVRAQSRWQDPYYWAPFILTGKQ